MVMSQVSWISAKITTYLVEHLHLGDSKIQEICEAGLKDILWWPEGNDHQVSAMFLIDNRVF